MAEKKGNILVIDDDPNLLFLLADTLTSIGYDCMAATDGIEALDMLGQENAEQFDLVVTDIKMPNMDGIGLLSEVRREFSDLPVLFITGVASEEIIAAASPDGFLAKPFRISQMEDLIERTLAAKHANKPSSKPRQVLLNLREDRFRDALSEALICSHYLPFAVSGGDEALEELERGSFDVMIAGVEKRGGQDRKAVRNVRTKHPNLPVLLISSSYAVEEANRLKDQIGFDGFLTKPCDMVDLISELDRTVSKRNQEKPTEPMA
ncbi:MAG: hypothetical protein DRP45_09895 [Candidatus Zixiibacteriota bacterium]|nr:MAG: hypothetical protein DRP45_09895 [candidate division Zixibacteria bacterium]